MRSLLDDVFDLLYARAARRRVRLRLAVGPVAWRPPTVNPPRVRGVLIPYPRRRAIMALVLTDLQQCSVTVTPEDKAGNPTALPSPPSWTVSDPTVLTLTVAADGLSAIVASTDKLGTCQLNVSATVNGAAVTGTLDVSVVASDATQLVVSTGTPADKP